MNWDELKMNYDELRQKTQWQKHRKTKIRNPSVRAVLAILFSSKFVCFMNGLLLFCALQRAMRFRRHSGCRDMSNEELGGIRFSSPAPSLPNSGYFCLEASPAHSLSSVKEMQTLFYSVPQQFKLKFQPKVLNDYPRHTSNLSFLLHGQNFWRIKFTPKNANFSR